MHTFIRMFNLKPPDRNTVSVRRPRPQLVAAVTMCQKKKKGAILLESRH